MHPTVSHGSREPIPEKNGEIMVKPAGFHDAKPWEPMARLDEFQGLGGAVTFHGSNPLGRVLARSAKMSWSSYIWYVINYNYVMIYYIEYYH